MEDGSDEGSIQKELQRFIKLAKSITLTHRQAAGAGVLELLRDVSSSPDDVATVLQHLATLAVDEEVDVRVTSLFSIPHIAMFFNDPNNTNDALRGLITTHILPIIVTALKDTDLKVVKFADNSIIALLEHWLIPSHCIREDVWPAMIYGLHGSSSEEDSLDTLPPVEAAVRIVTMMSKMVPWVGCDETKSLFVPMFQYLCSHPEFLVRRACASIIGDFCAVLEPDVVDSILVPKLVLLSEDKTWGVRRAVAESLLPAAAAAGTDPRRGVLTSVCAALLSDKHRAVQAAAFAALGPFIATFAPGVATLTHNHLGELVLKHGRSFEFKLNNSRTGSLFDSVEEMTNLLSANSLSSSSISSSSSTTSSNSIDHKSSSSDNFSNEFKEEDEFSSSVYWKDPIPNFELDPQLLNTSGVSEGNSDKSDLDDLIKKRSKYDDLLDQFNEVFHDPKENKVERLRKFEIEKQVPSELIHWFTSMTVSNEKEEKKVLVQHCAYNLPAVALTVGSDNWDLLEPTCVKLAADEQWKVRRIVASSIHELARIVGEEVATRDLVPIFDGFIKDLDEVRIGALKHLAEFIRLLQPEGRNAFLPKLQDFLLTDYDWNWRLRAELAEQLLMVLRNELFSAAAVTEHICPVSFTLLQDRAAHVRQVARQLMAEVMAAVAEDAAEVRRLVCQLAEQFAHSSKWVRRQTFAQLCACLVFRRSVPDDLFARDILPHLLDLSWDKVPNVRLAVARTLSHTILGYDYYSNPQSPHYEVLQINLKRLQGDRDRDVRALALPPPVKKFAANSLKTNRLVTNKDSPSPEPGVCFVGGVGARKRYLLAELFENFSDELKLTKLDFGSSD